MPDFTTDSIRNIVLLSHSGAGKTMLSEAMLHVAGVNNRLGSIEDGTTTSDFEPEEARRGTSIQTAIAACPWKGGKINIIDTPGYADYRGEVVSGVRIADSAVIVVAGQAGVEVGTRQMWQFADNADLPRLVFVSKLDRDNADFGRAMESLTQAFGRKCVAVQVPIGSENTFSGSINLLDQHAEVPADLEDAVEEARELLTEAVAETDDDLTMKYLEGEPLTPEEMREGLKAGIASGDIVPVFAGNSVSELGTAELMDALIDLLPSPSDTGAVDAAVPGSDEMAELACDSSGPLAALVFKTAADPFVGKLSYFRVYSGTFASDSQIWNANEGEGERIGQVFVLTGKTQSATGELAAGDIGAVSKLSTVLTGHTLTTRETPFTLPGLAFPAPVFHMAAFPKSKADVDKMTSSLSRIVEEDPSLVVSREPDTLEVLLGGLGDTHVDVAVDKMKRKFGVEILLEVPRVAYKETIASPARVEYRHKKQSGGHGQFGHVWLHLEPMSRGEGFSFASKIVGGVVPREYIPSVEKGVQRSLSGGVVAGFPVVDLKVTLVDGSYHSVDSSGMSFEIAGAYAFSKGVREATPVLLEPIMRASVTVPDMFAGDIIGDLNSKRGRILGMTPNGDGETLIEVEVPQAEMLRYATDLRSQTQGVGSFTMEFDHYEQVPQHLVGRLVEQLQEREAASV